MLLVITSHVGSTFPLLPYPLKRLTNFGWYGVQLFFLMSCVTLLLSWHAAEAKGSVGVHGFYVRRFFRVAPLYYLAAGFYFWFAPPMGGFDLPQLLASIFFVNAWYPSLIPTTGTGWTVVPGGWSIGVEFTFYAIFPLIAWRLRTMRSAVLFLICTLMVGVAANSLAFAKLSGLFGAKATEQFVFYWFFNQLPIFALGVVLYFGLARPWRLPRWGNAIILLLCAAGCVAVAQLNLSKVWVFGTSLAPPASWAASVIFASAACTIGGMPPGFVMNRAVRAMGTVSFSAYLAHFAVLEELCHLFPTVFDTRADDLQAVLRFAALWLSVVLITFCVSTLTYRAIESPMIALGRRLAK